MSRAFDVLVNAPAMSKMDAMNTFGAYMQAAFSKVCDKDDWKAPISATVKAEDLAEVIAAIEWMTATSVRVSHIQKDEFKVESIGYRAGPAGDH